MSTYSLNLSVSGNSVLPAQTYLAADSVNFVNAVFTFDSSWTGLYKTAVFRTGECVYHVPLEDDCCLIPYEAIKNGILYISVFGVSGTTRATTTEAAINVEKSGYKVCVPQAPSADPYGYFLEKVTAQKNQSQQIMEDCEAIKSDVQSINQQSETYKNSCSENAATAQTARDETLSAASLVQSANAAVQAAVARVETLEGSAEQSAESAASSAQNVLSQIEEHNSPDNKNAHPGIVAQIEQAKAIAKGKAASLSFNTKAQLDSWLAGTYTRPDSKTKSDLNVGDNLYIVDLNVPDYWWDGETIQPLGAEKPDLSDYYTKGQIDARINNVVMKSIYKEQYEAMADSNALEAGVIYFVYEEEAQ